MKNSSLIALTGRAAQIASPGAHKRWLRGLLLLGIVQLAGSARSMPNYDPFANQTADGGSAYTAGSTLMGQTNAPYYRWNGLGTNSTFQPAKPLISAENLSYPGLPTSSGGSVVITNSGAAGGGGARLDLKFTGLSGTFYYSYLLKLTNISQVPTFPTNNPISAFADDPSEQGARLGRMGSRVVVQRSGTSSYFLGIGRNNTPSEYAYETNTLHNLNDVVFVVASYELVGGVTNVNLWVNPPSSTFGASTPPDPTVTDAVFSNSTGNLNNSTGVRALAILCQFDTTPSGIIDELRAGQTWASVTGGLDFSLQPLSQGAIVGSNVTFTALAAGALPMSYVWQKDGVNLPAAPPYSGVNTRTLTITNVQHAQEGTYTVIATSGTQSVTSAGAYLTVSDPVLDPNITTQPHSTTNDSGASATFTVVATTSNPPLSYQWLKGANLLFDGGNISGALTDTLTISSLTTADQGDYRVVVMNGLGSSVTSSVATLTVRTPLVITAQPTARVAPQGGKTTLAVGVSGTGPFTYQWQLAGSDVTGATAGAYVLTNVQSGVTGDYRVIVTGPMNSETSTVATVSMLTEPLRLRSTNIVIMRVGDGAQGLTARGNSIFMDEFTPGGGLVGTVSIPDTGARAMLAIGPNIVTLSGGSLSISGSGVTRSLNGQYLVIGGYNAELGFPSDLNATSASAAPRAIGFVDSLAQYTMVVAASNAFENTFFRGAVSDGTNNFWGWGRAPGTYYFGYDAAAAIVQGDWSNLRSMGLFNGSIYGVSAVAGKTGVMKLPGLPTVTNDIQVLVNSGRTSSSDCDVSPDGNRIYVADDNSTANGGGIQRWDFDGSNWNLTYTLTGGQGSGTRYVTVDFTASPAVVYAVTSDTDNSQLLRIEDTGADAVATVLARAGANQTFRGLRLGPSQAPSAAAPVLSVTSQPGKVILNWSGSYFLQSAAEVTGPYTDVVNGTRPYTNSTTEAKQFFRLRQ